MKKIVLAAVALVLTLGQAQAALLLKFNDTTSSQSDLRFNDGGAFVALYMRDFDAGFTASWLFNPNYSLFSGPLLAQDTTLRVSSGPAFDRFAKSITDGFDDTLITGLAVNNGGDAEAVGSTNRRESVLFGNVWPNVSVNASTNGIDLASFVITEVVLTISNLNAPATSSGHSISYDSTLEIYGDSAPVPVPAAWPLMAAGVCLLGALRRLRRA